MTDESSLNLTIAQAYRAVVGLLREYGALMANRHGADALLRELTTTESELDARRSPSSDLWREWLGSLDASRDDVGGKAEPPITAHRAYDAMVSLLERLAVVPTDVIDRSA